MSKATNAQEFITEFANAFSGSGDSVKLDEFFADDVVFSDYSKYYDTFFDAQCVTSLSTE